MAITRTKLQANVQSHLANSMWWTDLNTTDPAAAKQFYGEVLNWTFEDMPSAGGNTYTVASRDGLKVAGLMELTEEMRANGMPSLWLTYVSVDDIQASCARAKELGATVMKEPWEIERAGWMCAIVDPTGAGFVLWQPTEHPGAEAVNGPGALCWLSLMTSDVEAATAFYAGMFGWTVEAAPGADMDGYSLFQLDGRPIGGVSGLMDGMPSSVWGVTLGVDDADWATDYVTQHGGTVLFGPHDTPWGRMVTIQDPQGAAVTLCGMQEQSMQ